MLGFHILGGAREIFEKNLIVESEGCFYISCYI